jgi:hypothetical protein
MKTSVPLLLFSAAISLASPVYQLHEWGTFTTVSGSDGVLLSGLEREEEALPAFVHSHFGMENGQFPDPAEFDRILRQHGTPGISSPGTKGLGRRPLLGVTVKMETPVIYFHSENSEPIHAKVKIGFDGGTISQWYPQRSGGEVLPEPPASPDPKNKPTLLAAWTLDFNKVYRGGIEWDINILPPAATRDLVLFKPDDTLGWLRTRQPVTNAVRTAQGETEGYLFYRGLGHFDPGLKTRVDAGETLHIENKTGGKIPYLVAFDLTTGRLRWSEQAHGLDAGGNLAIPESDLKTEPDGFSESFYRAVKTGLASCGLTDAEARSMVETWWHSYFETPGLRVFWVLPRETTDRLLPLEVSPPPTEVMRVLVGRSEVFRPRQETEWLAASRKKGSSADPFDNSAEPVEGSDEFWNYIITTDRFGLAIKERIAKLGEQTAAK